MEELLVKVPEAAAQLGISRAKLYELLAAGTVAVRQGRRLPANTQADLLEFVAGLDATVGVAR